MCGTTRGGGSNQNESSESKSVNVNEFSHVLVVSYKYGRENCLFFTLALQRDGTELVWSRFHISYSFGVFNFTAGHGVVFVWWYLFDLEVVGIQTMDQKRCCRDHTGHSLTILWALVRWDTHWKAGVVFILARRAWRWLLERPEFLWLPPPARVYGLHYLWLIGLTLRRCRWCRFCRMPSRLC